MPRKRTTRSRATKSREKTHTLRRASWKGNFSFGLVSFPVEAVNALNREGSDIHFNQLHAKCHNRIRYQKVCPVHGKVENDEIVAGYETSKGKYVEIDTDELDAARTERERALTIDSFIACGSIDPLYFDGRMYYLVPAGDGAAEPYSVIATAMEREERCGIGRIVFSGKDQIVLVRPIDGVLHMAMLNYEAEIVPPAKVADKVKRAAGASRNVKLAQTLIREWSEDEFDFSQYEDTYREKVEKLIEAKVKGRELVAPEEEEQEPEIVNLMDALKKSLKKGPGKPKRPTRTRRRKSA